MVTEEKIEELLSMAKAVRRNVVTCVGTGCPGHLGGSCSAADLITALYFYKMNYDPEDPARDRFILSKGHAAILQYSILAELGILTKEELAMTKTIDGVRVQGHPDKLKTPGIEAGTGSLGQGFSVALGMAIGQKLSRYDAKTYVLIGDGELEEGQIWEAAMAAGAKKLDNLIAIVDNNRLQATGPIAERLDYGEIRPKFEAFGWNVIEIDGHDMKEICDAYDRASEEKGRPTMILAHTVKGKGVSFAENVVGFHNGQLTEEQYEKALEELS